jgi:uncharacterized membrane protein YhiD involved in acid resistance
MFPDLQQLDLFPLSVGEILVNFLTAFICGVMISWLYRKTYKGPGYSPSFVSSMILLTLITTMVIMIIGNNLARAFGLVGAMSIIRFRTAVKDTIDIVFIFFALGVGLAAGSGALAIAYIGTTLIGGIILVLARVPIFGAQRREYLLQFSYHTNGGEQPPYLDVLHRYCKRQRMVNITAPGEAERIDIAYYVQLRDGDQNQRFLRDLQAVPGVRQVSMYFDDEQF